MLCRWESSFCDLESRIAFIFNVNQSKNKLDLSSLNLQKLHYDLSKRPKLLAQCHSMVLQTISILNITAVVTWNS